MPPRTAAGRRVRRRTRCLPARLPAFASLLAVCALVGPRALPAQEAAQEAVVRTDTLFSQVLQEARPLEVLYPKGYTADLPGGYDVLYVTDGLSDYLKAEVGWLQWEGFIPKNLLVIGVPNVTRGDASTRDRDFTPTRAGPGSGAAANFLAFFKQELIPYVTKTYPAKARGSTLFGSSLGGLFVTYALLHEPQLFTSYVAVDPSLWWDDFALARAAPGRLGQIKAMQATLYVAGRAGQPLRDQGVARLDSVLRRHAPPGLRWTVDTLRNETHYSTMLKGVWDGLKFSYGGYYASTGGYYSSRNIDCRPLRGTVLRNRPFPLRCFNLLAEEYLHYTTDGSAPTLASPRAGYRTAVTLARDAVVTVKAIGVRDEYNRTGRFPFRVVDSFPAQPSVPPGARAGGLRYDCYEGSGDTLADVARGRPVRSGVADSSFDVTRLGDGRGQASHACLLTGYLRVSEAGHYVFSMGGSDNDSRVLVRDLLVLGGHPAPSGDNAMVRLARGFYPFRIEYLRRAGQPALVPVYVEGEDGRQFPVPASWSYGVPGRRREP